MYFLLQDSFFGKSVGITMLEQDISQIVVSVPEYKEHFWEGKSSDYCLVIPVINEGGRIASLLDKITKLNIVNLVDIIIVDGGSRDGSLSFDLLKSHNVVCLLEKQGEGRLGSQLRCAYYFALNQGYSGVVTIDGNDKDDPSAIPLFVAKLKEGVDFIQGSRFIMGGEGLNTPKVRDWAIRYIHAPLLAYFSGFAWTDTTQGFRGYSSKLLLDSRVSPFREIFRSYELLAYMSYIAPKNKFKCLELPTKRSYPAGKTPTKISFLTGNIELFKTLIYACLGKYNVK